MYRKVKRKHIIEQIKKDETDISINITILASFEYEQWVKGIIKNRGKTT